MWTYMVWKGRALQVALLCEHRDAAKESKIREWCKATPGRKAFAHNSRGRVKVG